MKVQIGKYSKNGTPRKVSVQVDAWDTWSLDDTLANIILPCLQAYRANCAGYPFTHFADIEGEFDGTDVVEGMGSFSVTRWQAIVDAMIWSFERILDEDDENQFFADGNYRKEEHDAHQARISKGLHLFAEYFRALWN